MDEERQVKKVAQCPMCNTLHAHIEVAFPLSRRMAIVRIADDPEGISTPGCCEFLDVGINSIVIS